MFIKRDLRKIDAILACKSNSNSFLKFSNRKAEFDGSISVLVKDSHIDAITEVVSINLYGNDISNLEGIGKLAKTTVEEINLGNNNIKSLPLEFGEITTLKRLWLEDNMLSQFPQVLVKHGSLLSTLRLSGNDIIAVPDNIRSCTYLEILSLENNSITDFPMGCCELPNLKQLWLRQNKIEELPDDFGRLIYSLEVFSVSSNLLNDIPESIGTLTNLKKFYANGNRITSVPASLGYLPDLEDLNLANNQITTLPFQWLYIWGRYNKSQGGMLTDPKPLSKQGDQAGAGEANMLIDETVLEVMALGNPKCRVTLFGNPLEILHPS